MKPAILLLATVMSQNLFGAEVEFGTPTIAGTGCPAESATIVQSENGYSLSFDSYLAIADSEKSLDRKSCNIALPVKIPAGLKVSIASTELTGFAFVPKDGQAQMSVQSFLAGGDQGEKSDLKFDPGFRGAVDFMPELSEDHWSQCGQDAILRVNTSVLVQSGKSGGRSIVLVDSGSLANIKVQRCD